MSPLEAEGPPIGDVIELMRAGERQPAGTARVAAANGSLLRLEGCPAELASGSLMLRWWDDTDVAWELGASIERWDPDTGELTMEVVGPWRRAVLRRAARLSLDRAPVDLVIHGGDGREVRRIRVVCLDLSTTGCRVAGSGNMPADGDVVRVDASTSAVAVRVDARVVHVVSAAFGSWHAGLEFLPHTDAQRADLVVWRDSSTGG